MAEHAEVEIVRSSDPVMLPTNATVMMAARQMHSRGISAVLVVEDNAKLVGIFTERDAISRVLATGMVPRDAVTTGTAMAIATGAMLPRGADAVVMVEHTDTAGQTLIVRRPVTPGAAWSP